MPLSPKEYYNSSLTWKNAQGISYKTSEQAGEFRELKSFPNKQTVKL